MEQCERCGGLLLLDHVCNESEAELMKDMKAHLLKVNTVWVVDYHISYEGDTVEGVFSTEEKAKAFILSKDPDWTPSKRGDRYGYYSILIDEKSI